MIKRRGLGEEDRLHKAFSEMWQLYKNHKQICENFIRFTYIASGEKRSLITGSLLKAKGLLKGQPDYEIHFCKNYISHSVKIEFKVGKNKQSEEQKIYQKTILDFKLINEFYYVSYSLEDAFNILFKHNIINSLELFEKAKLRILIRNNIINNI